MLKLFSRTLPNTHSNPLSAVSLTYASMFFKARSKMSKKERLKRYLQNPKYQRVARLKIPDFKDPSITFPINIPIRYNFIYRPKKSIPNLPNHDFINFKTMTGNEILLNLSNVEYLRPSEFASALLELSRRDGAQGVDWNNHEWIAKCAEVATKNLAQYPTRVVSTLMYAFHKLGVNEPLLWSTLARESAKTCHKLKARGFAATFICFTSEPDRCTREYKERLASIMPNFLKYMNPSMFVKCFELALKDNLMSEYLFDNHFFVLVWRRNVWYGPDHYPKIMELLVKYGYTKDLEFWNKDFIPTIGKFVEDIDAEQAQKLIDALKATKASNPAIRINDMVEQLNERITFVNTTLREVENTKFWNVVKNDLEYYREKERIRLEKEKAKTTA